MFESTCISNKHTTKHSTGFAKTGQTVWQCGAMYLFSHISFKNCLFGLETHAPYMDEWTYFSETAWIMQHKVMFLESIAFEETKV